MKEELGYEVLDGKALCQEQEQEKQERLMRINGYDVYGNYDTEKDEGGGFLPRNNVRDRL